MARDVQRSKAADPRTASVLRRVRYGKVFNLDSGWWNGMPHGRAHPPFQVLSYRTPRGQRIDADLAWLSGAGNRAGFGFASELVIGSMHTGTHIDALCHVTAGDQHRWYGGESADTHLGDFGATEYDATTLPPIVTRGVLVDVPAVHGWQQCPTGYAITADDVVAATAGLAEPVQHGDALLVRTGLMRDWPEVTISAGEPVAGLSVEAAQLLVDWGAVVVGADTAAVEVQPSQVNGHPQPVHDLLIRQSGVPLIEWVYLEELAYEGVNSFAFVCLPLSIRGATGSLVRPIAIT